MNRKSGVGVCELGNEGVRTRRVGIPAEGDNDFTPPQCSLPKSQWPQGREDSPGRPGRACAWVGAVVGPACFGSPQPLRVLTLRTINASVQKLRPPHPVQPLSPCSPVSRRRGLGVVRGWRGGRSWAAPRRARRGVVCPTPGGCAATMRATRGRSPAARCHPPRPRPRAAGAEGLTRSWARGCFTCSVGAGAAAAGGVPAGVAVRH